MTSEGKYEYGNQYQVKLLVFITVRVRKFNVPNKKGNFLLFSLNLNFKLPMSSGTARAQTARAVTIKSISPLNSFLHLITQPGLNQTDDFIFYNSHFLYYYYQVIFKMGLSSAQPHSLVFNFFFLSCILQHHANKQFAFSYPPEPWGTTLNSNKSAFH